MKKYEDSSFINLILTKKKQKNNLNGCDVSKLNYSWYFVEKV